MAYYFHLNYTCISHTYLHYLSCSFSSSLISVSCSCTSRYTLTHNFKMKRFLFLCTESDINEAGQLQDYLQGKLRNFADLRNIADIIADEQDFGSTLRRSECVVLVGSRQASSFIQNKQQETEEDYITFDGKVIHDEFAQSKELVDRLIIVFLEEKTNSDWIPTGFDEKMIFNLKGGKIFRGNPSLTHLEYTIRRVLGQTALDW